MGDHGLMGTRGRKRTVIYAKVIEYKRHHPAAFQCDIAVHFGLTQSQVSKILRSGGVIGTYRGNLPKRQPGMSEAQFQWETILHKEGLGMDRGLKLNDQRIHYGYDPRKEEEGHESATLPGNSDFLAVV
jgi:hypothetical protein